MNIESEILAIKEKLQSIEMDARAGIDNDKKLGNWLGDIEKKIDILQYDVNKSKKLLLLIAEHLKIDTRFL